MHRTCIVLADAARARLFVLDRTADLEDVHETLVERADLVNPARRLTPSQLFSDGRPGSSRVGHRGFAFDDHREAHLDEMDAEFARAILRELEPIVAEPSVSRLIVCASPRMLGDLRTVMVSLRSSGLEIEEIPRDLVKLTPPQIREQLSSYGFLPA